MIDWFEEYGTYVIGSLVALLIFAPETAAGAFAAWVLVSLFVVFCAMFIGGILGGDLGVVFAFFLSLAACIGSGLQQL